MTTFTVYRLTIGSDTDCETKDEYILDSNVLGTCCDKPDHGLKSFIVEWFLNQGKEVPEIAPIILPKELMGYLVKIDDGQIFFTERKAA